MDGVTTPARQTRIHRISARMLLWLGERCITMAMAAGKSAGKPPRMTDKAFKPPAEAVIATIGNELPATGGGEVLRGPRTVFFGRRLDLDFGFMILLAMAAPVAFPHR